MTDASSIAAGNAILTADDTSKCTLLTNNAMRQSPTDRKYLLPHI